MKKYFMVFSFIFALAMIAAVDSICFANLSDHEYIRMYLTGTAEDLEKVIDKDGWDANKILTVKLHHNDGYHELFEYFVERETGESVTFTPLFLAAGNKDSKVVELLLNRGATITQEALNRALSNWMTDNVLLLLNKARELGIKYDSPGAFNERYCHVTFFVPKNDEEESINKTVLQYLIDYGSFSENQHSMFLNAASRVTDPDFYIILEDNGIEFQDNVTELLAVAAERGRLRTTKFFLERGGDPNTTVKVLIGYERGRAKYKDVPLIVRAAVRNGDADILAALLKAGADPNAQDLEGKSALMYLDEKIHKLRVEIQEIDNGTLKGYLSGKDHKIVKRGTEEWNQHLQECKSGNQKSIKRLEASRAVLIQAGAQQ